MLPLEGILFIPSLFVVPVAVVAIFFLRRSQNYARLWLVAGIVCFVLCGWFLVQVLNTPLYSERDRSPDNPGGFSTGVTTVIALFLLMTCAVIPAFPVLIALACMPHSSWHARTRLLLVVLGLLYVGILAWLIARKNATFVADYRQTKQQERQQGDQFQHLRHP